MIVEKPNDIKFTLSAEEATYLKNILFSYGEQGSADIHNFATVMAQQVGIISHTKESVDWRDV